MAIQVTKYSRNRQKASSHGFYITVLDGIIVLVYNVCDELCVCTVEVQLVSLFPATDPAVKMDIETNEQRLEAVLISDQHPVSTSELIAVPCTGQDALKRCHFAPTTEELDAMKRLKTCEGILGVMQVSSDI